MSEENIKRFNESVHSLYNTIMDKPLQVLSIFNDFFGEDKVDMQGVCSEDRLRSWIEAEPVTSYLFRSTSNIDPNTWDRYSTKSIMELSQSEFEDALSSMESSVFRKDIIVNIVRRMFNNMFILVHFPHVRITNEHNRFVDINHLWAKITIEFTGTMFSGFTLNRSEYQASHFIGNYMHSHIRDIPKNNFTKFQSPCTGSGPIRCTIDSLNRRFNSDLWRLFCLELNKYVTTESIEGVPYHYLESIGSREMNIEVAIFTVYNNSSCLARQNMIEKFTKYFVRGNHLKFNYVNGSYSIGMSFIEFIVVISNEFIKWYNEQFNDNKVTDNFMALKTLGIVKECIIKDGKIYYNKKNNNADNYTHYIGSKVCVFKGKEITLSIVDIPNENSINKSIILSPQIALFILNQILKVLNYRYGRKTATHTEHQIGTEVRYL